jgi:hypothetical protein
MEGSYSVGSYSIGYTAYMCTQTDTDIYVDASEIR